MENIIKTNYKNLDYFKISLESTRETIAKLPEEVKFCKKCVVSNQRPRIVFDNEGVWGL